VGRVRGEPADECEHDEDARDDGELLVEERAEAEIPE
jgi:hypothetical protein